MEAGSNNFDCMMDETAELLVRQAPLNGTTDQDIRKELEHLWVSWKGHDPEPLARDDITQRQISSGLHWVHHQTPNIKLFYDLGDVVGIPGQYGTVRTARCKKTGEDVAVKIIDKHVYKDQKIRTTFYKDLRHEVFNMFQAREHPRVVTIYSVFENVEHVYIVMEKLCGGELYDFLQANRPLQEQVAAQIFAQMLDAIYYLHSRNIVHCDIKPENFVFASKDYKSLKCIDFGMSKIIRWRKHFKRMDGTPYYVAPEVLKGHYDEASDIWSLGVCLFILLFGVPPFFSTRKAKKEATRQVYQKIQEGFHPCLRAGHGPWFPTKIRSSVEARDLIARMLRKNTADRVTAEEALGHQWFRTACSRTEDRGRVDPVILQSIVGFHDGPRLLKEIITVLDKIGFLNHHQRLDVLETHKQIDSNQDGLIQMTELYDSLRKYHPNLSETEVKYMFRMCDINKDGVLESSELLSARVYRKVTSKIDRLKKLFRIMDTDGNGIIDAHELQGVLETCSTVKDSKQQQHEALMWCRELIEEVDVNGDGKIDYEEFLDVFGVRTRRKMTWESNIKVNE